jgi:hypothetical protein
MYCTQCGAPYDDTEAKTCTICGAKLMSAILAGESIGNFDFGSPTPEASNVAVPSYLVQAILVTFFCCLPFGVPAIVYAAQVDSKLRLGDVAGAQAASKNARTWCWVSFAIGAMIGLAYLLIMIIAVANAPPPRMR